MTGRTTYENAVRGVAYDKAGRETSSPLGLGAWSFCFFGFAFARAWLEIVTYRTTTLFAYDA